MSFSIFWNLLVFLLQLADRNSIIPGGFFSRFFHYIIFLHSPAEPGVVFALKLTNQNTPPPGHFRREGACLRVTASAPLQFVDGIGDRHVPHTFGRTMDCGDTGKHDQQNYDSDRAKWDVPATAKMRYDHFNINPIME